LVFSFPICYKYLLPLLTLGMASEKLILYTKNKALKNGNDQYNYVIFNSVCAYFNHFLST